MPYVRHLYAEGNPQDERAPQADSSRSVACFRPLVEAIRECLWGVFGRHAHTHTVGQSATSSDGQCTPSVCLLPSMKKAIRASFLDPSFVLSRHPVSPQSGLATGVGSAGDCSLRLRFGHSRIGNTIPQRLSSGIRQADTVFVDALSRSSRSPMIFSPNRRPKWRGIEDSHKDVASTSKSGFALLSPQPLLSETERPVTYYHICLP